MEIKISREELSKRSLFVATPMFGGMCNGTFARSMQDLTAACVKYDIDMRCYYLFNESLIPRARTYCVDEFMRSGMSHMMFIDADIGFNPSDVIALLALQTDESDYDVIGAAYPKKTICWEKIKQAVDKGFADENPNNLEDFVGDFVFNPIFEQGQHRATIRLDEPAEVSELGTGFMMIRRKVLEDFQAFFPEKMYLPDHARTENFDGTREICLFFDCEIDPVSRRYLSEDYMFCRDVRKMGGKIWLCPWMHLTHSGSYVFGGNLAALAAIGASATADHTKLRQNKTVHPGTVVRPNKGKKKK